MHDFDQTVSRKHYLTKQDIRNISTKVTDNLVKKHKEDALSVQLTVEELQQEPFNPVLIYKPQGVTNPNYPTLSEDAFVLAVQTEFQMQLYQTYAESVLCIDSTHGTNAYNFTLITCIVADNFGQGMA